MLPPFLQTLLLSEKVQSTQHLRSALMKAEAVLSRYSEDTSYGEVAPKYVLFLLVKGLLSGKTIFLGYEPTCCFPCPLSFLYCHWAG